MVKQAKRPLLKNEKILIVLLIVLFSTILYILIFEYESLQLTSNQPFRQSKQQLTTGARTIKCCDYVACRTELWLDFMNDFYINYDFASFNNYIDTNRCIIMKGGLTVTVTGQGSNLGILGFIHEETQWYTYREAIN